MLFFYIVTNNEKILKNENTKPNITWNKENTLSHDFQYKKGCTPYQMNTVWFFYIVTDNNNKKYSKMRIQV